MDNILASSIRSVEHLAVFDKIASARLAAIEVERSVIYVIDMVPAPALGRLAEQLDVLGYKGWKLATTDEKKRAILKRSIELHRYKGTIYAIEEALKSFGYAGAVIQEHVGTMYDGSSNHDGVVNYGTENWATFRVTLDLGNSKGINTSETTEATALINEYKNARSHLVDIGYMASLSDELRPSEAFSMTITYKEDTSDVVAGSSYDGEISHDGGKKYNSGYREGLEITEVAP